MITLINIVVIMVSMEWMQGCLLVWFRLIKRTRNVMIMLMIIVAKIWMIIINSSAP